jgi:hypothetical protein
LPNPGRRMPQVSERAAKRRERERARARASKREFISNGSSITNIAKDNECALVPTQ